MKRSRSTAAARAAGSAMLWVLAVIGLVSGALWVGNAAGLVQPLIVVSGSMAPEIDTGDLLVATPTPARDLRVGDVASLPNEGGVFVTHRIVELERSRDTVTLRLQGDANAHPDAQQHLLGADDPVWTPVLTIPGAGYVAETLMRPEVGVPLLAGLLALAALAMIPSRRQGREDEARPEEIAPEPDKEKELVSA
ncbi:signal peptidase I [Microbacterium immunditiarum]|uniref:Signal peptidase I n=1 Tax=Microbacterium immunditiarum TaxID=337480 RepID=A0A7Y9GPM0_9MICO|nr:signal peptidase I [Microbacterium immunditiarum]NYE20249.1 signal peptidase [Microbacterium immunditiarum]